MPEAKRKIIMLFSREMKRILGENLKKVILLCKGRLYGKF